MFHNEIILSTRRSNMSQKRTSDESFPESGKGGKRYVPRPNIKRGKYNEVNCVESETSSIDSDTRIYLDSCASEDLCIVTNANMLTECRVDSDTINLTESGKSMKKTHVGSRNGVNNIFVCPSSRKNICSLSKLKSMGYGFTFMGKAQIVALEENIQLQQRLHQIVVCHGYLLISSFHYP